MIRESRLAVVILISKHWLELDIQKKKDIFYPMVNTCERQKEQVVNFKFVS